MGSTTSGREVKEGSNEKMPGGCVTELKKSSNSCGALVRRGRLLCCQRLLVMADLLAMVVRLGTVEKENKSQVVVVRLRKDKLAAEESRWLMCAEVELNAPGGDWGWKRGVEVGNGKR